MKPTKDEIRKNNLFNIEQPHRKILAFVTQGGHLSGQVMKNIDYRLPARIEKMKTILVEQNEIGSVIETDYVVFIVLRKHYNTKMSEKTFEDVLVKALPNISDILLKTTNEDWPQFEHLIRKYIPTIEYRLSSEWP